MLITSAIKRVEKKTGLKVHAEGDFYWVEDKTEILEFRSNCDENMSLVKIESKKPTEANAAYYKSLLWGSGGLNKALELFIGYGS